MVPVDDLRLTLLGVGALILLVLVIAHRRHQNRPKTQADWRRSVVEPKITSSVDPGDTVIDEIDATDTDTADYRNAPHQPGLKGIAPASVKHPSEVITLYVRRKDQGLISGPTLADAARRAGLSFGEMDIFHRAQEGYEQPVFSMANLVAPGTFNPDDWDTFKTPGVTLFATLPGSVSALDCWDSMLATATRLTELLDGEILDANRLLLSRKRIGETRDRMRQLDRDSGWGEASE